MKFYKYWVRGEAPVQGVPGIQKVRAYGGSDDGIEAALQRAVEAAQRAAAAVMRGQPRGVYGYADRPLREEIVEEIRDGNELSAVITRNSYGALVLNSSWAMFVDVDYFPPPYWMTGEGGPSLMEGLREIWERLRGRPSSADLERDAKFLHRFQEVVDAQPGMGARIYRTAGGFRILVTSGTFDPLAENTQRLLSAFGSDPLYTRLCKMQECFRARLSAKYWRCDAKKPPPRLPWADAAQEQRYRQWEQDYHQRANQFAACELVQTIGDPALHDLVRPILDTHDRLALHEGAELA